MKIYELIGILAKHPPETEVLIWSDDDLCPISETDFDCFHPAGPWGFTLDPDDSAGTIEAVSTWLDGEGELPTAIPDRLRLAIHALPSVVDEYPTRQLAEHIASLSPDMQMALWHRLQDDALLNHPDMQESLRQMREGQLTPARTLDEEQAA